MAPSVPAGWPYGAMPVLCSLSLISRNSPKQLGMVSPELPSPELPGMRYQATQCGLKGEKRKTMRGAAEYFERNRDRMKYDEYLAAGYPIGSGVVEGACRHLVKDRMERTGMRGCRPERKRCWTYEPPTSMASGMPSGTSTSRRRMNGFTVK